jgi:hypothetical protein
MFFLKKCLSKNVSRKCYKKYAIEKEKNKIQKQKERKKKIEKQITIKGEIVKKIEKKVEIGKTN